MVQTNHIFPQIKHQFYPVLYCFTPKYIHLHETGIAPTLSKAIRFAKAFQEVEKIDLEISIRDHP